MKTKHKILFWLARLYKRNVLNLNFSDISNIDKFNRILVLSTTAIGDTLLSTPVFSALRKYNPSAVIKVMIRDKYCDFFKNNPDIDGIIPFKKGVAGIFKTKKSVKKNNFEIAFVAHISDPAPVVISAAAGIPYIVGECRHDKFGFLFSLKNTPNPDEHVILNRLEPVKSVTSLKKNLPNRMVLPTDTDATKKVWQNFYNELNIPPDITLFIGFQPGASRSYRMWPKKNFIKLGKKLLAFFDNLIIIIFGSPDEASLCKDIEEKIGQKERAFYYDCSLADLPHMLKGIDCLVTNDTGPMHIAIAVRTSTVSLFVPSDSHRIGPFQDMEKHRVIVKEKPCKEDCTGKKCDKPLVCMDLIPVDEVFEAAINLLKNKGI